MEEEKAARGADVRTLRAELGSEHTTVKRVAEQLGYGGSRCGVGAPSDIDYRRRGPSNREVRHALLTDLIREVHGASRGTYGYRRPRQTHLGRGLVVADSTVELLMARAGLAGVPGRPRWKGSRPDLIAKDLIDRQFGRDGPIQL